MEQIATPFIGGIELFARIFFGSPAGLIAVSIILVIYGSQKEDKDDNNKPINKGLTSFSKVLYVVSSIIFIIAIYWWYTTKNFFNM